MGQLLGLSLIAALLALSCDAGSRESREGVTNGPTPFVSPTTTPEAGCDLEPPRRVRNSVFKPPVETEGDEVRLRVIFLDGTRATLRYPEELRLTEDGIWPDTTGGERGGQVRPQISYGGVHFRISGEPVDCLKTRDGSPAGVWRHPDGDILILRFGKWFVSVFDDYANLDVWAAHLRGRITRDGWLVLKGDDRLKIGPEQRYGDTSIMLGGLDPGVLLWPLRCRGSEDTAADVVAGPGIDGPAGKEAFASWCDRDVSMQVHVYASAEFIKQVAAGLSIDDVTRTHPLSRYHIVP